MQLKVTLKRSTIGCRQDQIGTVRALGLKKIGNTTIQPDNAQTRGKIAKISFLVKVEDAE